MSSNCCTRTCTYSLYTTIQQLFGDLSLPSSTLTQMIPAVPDFLDALDINTQGFSTNQQLLDLFEQYIIPSYYKSTIDIETYESDEEVSPEHEELLGRINTWCITTLKYYGVLAKFYTDNESKLLEQIKSTSTSTSKASDTPEVSGKWDGDDQLSSIASSEVVNSTDNGSMMSRLSEIRRGYRDIMQLWMRDFYKNFLQEVLTW